MINFSLSFGEYNAKSWDFHAFMLAFDHDSLFGPAACNGGLDVANFTYCGEDIYISSLIRVMRLDDGWSLDLLYIRFISRWLLNLAIARYDLTIYAGWSTVLSVLSWPVRRFFCKDKRNPLLSWYYNGKKRR